MYKNRVKAKKDIRKDKFIKNNSDLCVSIIGVIFVAT